jgi:hypothetical protein
VPDSHKDDPDLDDITRRLGGADGPTWRQQLEFLRHPLVREVGRQAGLDLEVIDKQYGDALEGLAALHQAAIWFAPFGWAVGGRVLKTEVHIEAVELYERSRDEAAIDALLTKAWADGPWLRGSFGPLTTLAGGHEATLELLLKRNDLLFKALKHHEQGEYAASVLIVLTQIDGVTFDMTDGRHGFFLKAKDWNFVDSETFAGLPIVLRAVWKSVMRDPHETRSSGAFLRGPIMHGRELAFASETNSTKAFALLAAVIEWLKPKAAALVQARFARDAQTSSPGQEGRGYPLPPDRPS